MAYDRNLFAIPGENYAQYQARLAQGPTRDIQLQAGNPAAVSRQTNTLSQSIASNIPANASDETRFMLALQDLLVKSQKKLTTRPFVEQGLNAQQEQVGRVLAETPQSLIGASPATQSAVRGAEAQALQPTIAGAEQGQRTFGEYIQGIRDTIGGALDKLNTLETLNQREEERKFKEKQFAADETYRKESLALERFKASKVEGGKPVSGSIALQIADSRAAKEMLVNLKKIINTKGKLFGPIIGRLGASNPYNVEAQDVQSSINATKQIVGKYLEGGVLRKEDEVKYEKILPKLSDSPEVAKRKLANVEALVKAKIDAQSATLSASGYNPALTPTGNETIIGPDGLEYEIID